MTLREAAQQALEACTDVVSGWESLAPLAVRRAAVESLDALRAALAEDALERMSEDERRLGIQLSTHSADCYQWHHECAVAEVERLRAAIAKAIQAREKK